MLRTILARSLPVMWMAAGCTPSPSSADEPDMETGIFLPSTSDSSSGDTGGDEGDSGSSGSGGATEGDALLPPACQGRDPGATAAMSVAYGAWGAPDVLVQPTRSIVAECYLAAFSWSAGSLHVALDCTEGDLVDQTISADIDLAEHPDAMLQPGAKVYFSGGWDLGGEATREHFVLYDVLGRVRVAALRNVLEEASDLLWPLALARVDDACPWACAGDCAEGGDPSRRNAVRVAYEESATEVLDGHRGELTAGAMRYTISVGEALETYVDHQTHFRSALVILGEPGA